MTQGLQWYRHKILVCVSFLCWWLAAVGGCNGGGGGSGPAPTITVTSPNGGESWEAGTTAVVTWSTTGTVSDVKIDISTDGGITWGFLAASVANDGSENVNVPSITSSQCLVRIAETDDSPSDSTDSLFSIAPLGTPTITVANPSGGEIWIAGSQANVVWSSSGAVKDVIIELSTDGGTAWNTLVATTPNDGIETITVPISPSSTALIRVSETDGDPTDTTSSFFSIAPAGTPSVAVTSPNGGETWTTSSSATVTWTTTGTVGNVKIELSLDGGVSWTNLASNTANDGTEQVDVPSSTSSAGLVRVSETDGSPSDASDTFFSIAQAGTETLTLLAPTGGESWEIGVSYSILWTSSGLAGARIELSRDGGTTWEVLVASTPASSGSYFWTVTGPQTTQTLVRVSDLADSSPSDVSIANFDLLPPPSITVTSPNGGESLTPNSTFPVTWTSTGSIAAAMIELSTDNGATWNVLLASTPNDGIENITVPGTVTTLGLIRISDSTGTQSDFSDGTFTIAPPIVVLAPNGGEVLAPGSIVNLTWTTNGVSDVTLRFSTDGGTTWKLIGNGSVDTTSCQWRNFPWSVPNDPSTSVLVRVEDSNDSAVLDESNAEFEIAAHPTIAAGATPDLPFTLTAPNGGDVIAASSTYSITWNSATGFADVNLYYSIDCGANWTKINGGASINIGDLEWENFPWTVPNVLSDQVLIRIEDYNAPTTEDISDGSFLIVAPITISTPNGGEVVSSGTTYNIQWTTVGITDVTLQYSTDGGTTFTTIAGSVDTASPNWLSYPWDTTGIFSTNVIIRIEEYNNSAVFDTSDAPFALQ